MTKTPEKPRDRYDSSGNPEAEYPDAEHTVLVNTKGITDLHTLQVAEEESLAAAYETLLGEVRVDTPMTSELLRHIHGRIFGDLYTWAGRWRTVWISKPGITWAAPDFWSRTCGRLSTRCLAEYPAPVLTNDEPFCRGGGENPGGVSRHPPVPRGERADDQDDDELAGRADRPAAARLRSHGRRAAALHRGGHGRLPEGLRAASRRYSACPGDGSAS